MPDTLPLVNGIKVPNNSFVAPDHKVVYISCTKVACTAMRWMMADLTGEDFDRFFHIGGGFQTKLMTIHGPRSLWQHTPQMRDLPQTMQHDIATENGWFIFGFVRNPWSRIWSAWQSKLLVRQPMYVRQFGDEAWFPRVPEKAEDVLEDWQAFMEAAPFLTHPKMKNNRHFLPQVVSVQPAGINYTRIYDISEMSQMTAELGAHLDRVGKPHKLYLPRANETPLVLTAAVLDNGIGDRIREVYAADFAAFGDRFGWTQQAAIKSGDWTMDAVRAVGFRVDSNERIADLAADLDEARGTRKFAGDTPGGDTPRSSRKGAAGPARDTNGARDQGAGASTGGDDRQPTNNRLAAVLYPRYRGIRRRLQRGLQSR